MLSFDVRLQFRVLRPPCSVQHGGFHSSYSNLKRGGEYQTAPQTSRENRYGGPCSPSLVDYRYARIWLAEGRLEALSSILSRRTARFNVCLDSRLNGRQESLGSGQSTPRFGARPPQATGWYGMVLHRRTTARPNTRLQKINAYIHY